MQRRCHCSKKQIFGFRGATSLLQDIIVLLSKLPWLQLSHSVVAAAAMSSQIEEKCEYVI